VIYKDLRGFIKQVEALGVLRRIDGADPRFEIGGITEVAAGLPECPTPPPRRSARRWRLASIQG
jgi:3-polyprenyl-4-hydroxybenzoate decarboxylase